MEGLRQDGLDQAEALIRYHLGLTQSKISRMTDEEFCEAAALAYFYEDRWVLAVKRGLLMGLAEISRGS